MAELRELADAIDANHDGNVTGIHPKEERGVYRARAMQSRYLTRYLYRLYDKSKVDTPIARARAAKAHPYVQAGLADGREVIGSRDHLHDMMYRDARAEVDADELARLLEIEEDAAPLPEPTPIQAAAAGVHRSTEWRRRKRAAA